MRMAPVTRSKSMIVRKLKLLHKVKSDAQYIKKVDRSFRSTKVVLSVTIEKTKQCLYWYQPYKREIPRRKIPSRQTSQVKTMYTCVALINVKSIYDAHQTGPHANEINELVTSLDRTVNEFNIVTREQRRLKSLPPKKCKYCKKWFTLDPWIYYQQYCREIKEKAKTEPSEMDELSQVHHSRGETDGFENGV